jgi:hypothetical protein
MSSDSNIYIKTIETDSELGAFEVTGTGVTSLITPNSTKTGYSLSQTSFVVGSDQLDDYSSTTDRDKRMFFDKIKGAFRAGSALNTQWDNTDSNPNRGVYSTALGLNNIASGDTSFAAGANNTTSSDNTVSLGAGNTSSADNAVTIGYLNNATAVNAVAIGNNNTSSTAANAVAIGQYCNASGANSFAIGYGTDTTTNANTAIGTGSVAIGYKNSVSGENSVAIGKHNNIVSGANNAYAIGQSCSITSANATESIVMGTNATMDANTGTRCFFWNGDSSPRTMPTSTTGSVCFNCSSGGAFKIHFAGTAASVATSTDTGYSWISSSSRDLKENLVEHDYSDTLTRIMDMPIYTYNFKTVAPGIKSIGPVAQDFNRLFPSDKDPLGIVDRDMCGVALAGVKGVKLGLDSLSSDVNTRFENVDSRFASNSDTTSALQSRIAVLESSLVSASTQIAAVEGRLAALEAP